MGFNSGFKGLTQQVATLMHKTDNVRVMQQRVVFVQQLLQWKSITYSECVSVDLGISMQCACAILSSVSCRALQYFCTLSHKRHYSRKKTAI